MFELIQRARAVGMIPEFHSQRVRLERTRRLNSNNRWIGINCSEEEVRLRVLSRFLPFFNLKTIPIREGGYQVRLRGRLSTKRSTLSIRGIRRKDKAEEQKEEANGVDGKWAEEEVELKNLEPAACRV